MADHFSIDRTLALPGILSGRERKTLIIGDLKRWKSEGRRFPLLNGIQFVAINQLTAEVIAKQSPELVLSPLVSGEFDVMDVAILLSDMGFTGLYRAIATDVPDTKLIKQEVCNIAPSLNFDLLIMPGPIGELT